MPFMVGFNMQTKGWDIALRQLKVGDFAEIIIPSELARGSKGIEGLIPPNADNILKIRPPLTIDNNDIDCIISALDECLNEVKTFTS